MSTGAYLRDQGIRSAEIVSLWDDWPARADSWIEFEARTGRPFTAEDLRSACGDPSRSSLLGAAVLKAARRGLIEKTGYRTAERPERHGGVVAVWRGTDDAS